MREWPMCPSCRKRHLECEDGARTWQHDLACPNARCEAKFVNCGDCGDLRQVAFFAAVPAGHLCSRTDLTVGYRAAM